jgi:AsmA family protein
MTKWRRVGLGSAGAVAIAALVGALALHALVDPERLKKIARDKARAAWSRELSIGELSLDLWPLPSLHAQDVALADPAGGKDSKPLEASSITARLALLPLLTGKVRLKRLDLEGVKADLSSLPASVSRQPGSAGSADSDFLDLTSLHIADADITQRPKGGPKVLWHIEDATAVAASGLRDVRVEAKVARNRRPLAVKASFDDLSRIGVPRAVTPGQVELDWGKAQLALAGQFPLTASLANLALHADLEAQSLTDLLVFFGSERRPRAPVTAHLDLRDAKGTIEVTRLAATLGKLKVTGDMQLALSGPKTSVNARLATDRLDWAQTALDAGGPVIPERPTDELFNDTPLEWPLLVAMLGSEAKLDLTLKSLLLRNGVELRNTRARAAVDGDRMNLSAFTAETLGGKATGSMLFEGRKKSVRVDFDGTNLLLERWFHERGSSIPFTGGPMKVKASFSTAGDSMKALAAAITGPITIRMGPGVWASQKAGDAEARMTSALAPKGASRIDFECVGAALPFDNGRASARPIIGISTSASHLVTSGVVDMREETIDVRGRVKAKSGVSLATLAGDVKIVGKIRHPKMSVAEAAYARVGAAIATAGISVVGTVLADAGDAKSNPCDAVLAAMGSRR